MGSVGSDELEAAERGERVAVLGPTRAEKPNTRTVIEEFKAFAKGRSLGGIPIRELIDGGRFPSETPTAVGTALHTKS